MPRIRCCSTALVVSTAILCLVALGAGASIGGRHLVVVEVIVDGAGGTVDGLDDPFSVSMSPDGNHVYVAGFDDNAVAVSARSATLGTLTFVEVERDGVAGVSGLTGAIAVTVSPDGENAYVAGNTANSIAVFSRNSSTGELAFVESVKDGVGGVDGLEGAIAVTVSPDGGHVYAAGHSDDDALAMFTRNPSNRALIFEDAAKNGVGRVANLWTPFSASVSPDGRYV